MSEITAALPLAIFAVSFFLIFTERINRTLAALLGALGMVVAGVMTGQEALESVSFTAILSIVGILVLVSVVRSSGLFAYLAIKVAKLARGNPAKLMVAFSLLSTAMSSFLGSTATILIMGGLIVTICKQLNLRAPPYLMAAALMSSIGGGLLLTGSSINILLSQAAGLSFAGFLYNTFPICLALALGTAFFFGWYFRMENKPAGEILLDERQVISDWRKFYISSALLLGTVLLMAFSGFLGLTIGMVAIGAGLLALLVTGFEPERAFKEIQWETLFFLVGVFVIMGGLEKTGIFHTVANFLSPVMSGFWGLAILLWSVGPMSGIVHSLPMTVALIPIVEEIAKITARSAAPMFWTLVLGINLGENLTPLGSTSSILAMGIGKNSGQPFSFAEFLKVSVITTLLHFLIVTGWVLLRYPAA